MGRRIMTSRFASILRLMRSKLLDEAHCTADRAAKLFNAVASLQIRIASPPMQQDIHSKREEMRTAKHEKKNSPCSANADGGSNMGVAITTPSSDEVAKESSRMTLGYLSCLYISNKLF